MAIAATTRASPIQMNIEVICAVLLDVRTSISGSVVGTMPIVTPYD